MYIFTWYASFAECSNDVYAEERHPADEEHAHDYSYRDSRLVVRHMVGGWMHVRLDTCSDAFSPVIRELHRSGHGADRFDMLLGIAV